MRVPRRHRFRSELDPGELFRRLPPEARFRLAGPGRTEAFGAEPRSVVSPATAAGDPSPLLSRSLRTALPRVPGIDPAGGSTPQAGFRGEQSA
jgi:hypothetical protein